LAGLLWGDATEANARAALRKSLVELRRLAGSNLLISRHEVALDRDSDYQLDVQQFELGAQALQDARGEGLTPALATELAAAVALYRGDFMAGFHVLRARAFYEWILLERERLRLSALQMNYTLAIHFFTQADNQQATSYAQQVIALEPCYEEAHRLLMSLLALSGQQAAALRQYQVCCDALQEELGLDPNPHTTALYERIRDSLENQPSGVPLRPQLERPALPIIGRKKEINDILAQLQDPRCRLLTLHGPGGSGKTHLAREIAAIILAQEADSAGFAGQVHLISLGFAPSIAALAPAIAQGVGFYFAQEARPWRQLLSYLSRQQALLILDACEGLLDLYDQEQGGFVDLINEILGVAPRITILATSRTRLNAKAEILYPLTGLTYPDPIQEDAEELLSYDAVQLFLWRMRRVQPDFSPGDLDLTAIGYLCRYVKGMPLEILLMANWSRLLNPYAIWKQLETGGSAASRTVSPLKQELKRNLLPIFDHSWQLLNDRERQRLAVMSVFQDGFTYEQIQALSGISHRDLLVLVDQSIVNQIDLPSLEQDGQRNTHRFDLHDLLCEYVTSFPGLASWLDQAHEQHATYFLGRLHTWAEALLDAREQETLRRLDLEIANIHAAWVWAAAQGRFDLLDQGFAGLGAYYQRRFRHAEGESDCRTAVQALRASAHPQPRILAKALAWQACFTAESEPALSLLDEALDLLDEMEAGEDGRAERALVLFTMGQRLLNSDHDVGREKLETSLQLYLQLGWDWHAAQTYHLLHIQHWKAGDPAMGREVAQQGLALFRKIGYLQGYAAILGDQGIRLLLAGCIDEGAQTIEESVEIFEQLGDRAGIVKGLYFKSMALAFQGQWAEAVDQLQSCVPIGAEVSNFYDTVLIALAISYAHTGQYEEAGHYAHLGLDLASDLDNKMCVGRAYAALALVALAGGRAAQAAALAQQSVAVYEQFEQKTELGTALAALGYAACQAGAYGQAQECFAKAVQVATDAQDQISLLYASLGSILLLAYNGQAERAQINFNNAAQHPIIANSLWFRDLVQNPIDRALGQ
jgi:DNA-binding SARP family transcriptional activator/predicted ATPase